MHNQEQELFARCASGFEQTLAQELKNLSIKRVRPLRGGVAFFGSMADAYKACLWSRVATRIQLVLVRVGARNANELYHGTLGFAWENHLGVGSTISVEAHGSNAELRNTKFVALKVKDAICDRMRSARGVRPNIDARHPDFAVNVAVHEQRATIYLNLSGESLHRREYREDGVQTEAPLKETLAAGILLLAKWPETFRSGGCFADPMCGSGTLAIEAALMASNTAPGLLRTRWGFEGWLKHDKTLWSSVLEQAQAQVEYPTGPAAIVAGDIDPNAVSISKSNAERAGVDMWIRFYTNDASRLKRHMRGLGGDRASFGLMATNPPYGMRLLSSAELPQTYLSLATAAEGLGDGWNLCVITPDAGIDATLGRTPAWTTPCLNGPISTWIRMYSLGDSPSSITVTSLDGKQAKVPFAEPNSAQFASRLRKNARDRVRWARKEHIGSFRTYDTDLPDYPLSIDVYHGKVEGHSKELLRIQETRRPKSVDVQQAQRRLADAANIASAIFGIPREDAFVLPHDPDSNKTSKGMPGLAIRIEDNGLAFDIDPLATSVGLPLCMREVRAAAGKLASSRRVAALFASSTPCLAAALANGAKEGVLIDASKGQLAKGRECLTINGISSKRYKTACMDIRSWTQREQKAGHTYDLILCTPPTWLPKKDAGSAEWDLRQEYADLLRTCARILAKNGIVLFAYAASGLDLNMHVKKLSSLHVEDISKSIVPHDFERSREKPRCFLVK